MSVVYRAYDRTLRRFVALKVLHQQGMLHPVLQERFDREGKIMAGLSHPNVVSIHDMGEQEGRSYIAMELVAGRTLEGILAGRFMPLRSLLEILHQVAQGVAHAHAHGVIHRDLKPGNILVTPSGQAKVTDFGIAHLMQSEMRLTDSGASLGTPFYMAPEQIRGASASVNERTDVYALGAILYEMVAGAPPHSGKTPGEIFTKVLNAEPVPLRKRNRRVHEDVVTICMKALEREPSARYATARAFAEDLEKYLREEPISAKPPTFGRRTYRAIRRYRAIATAVAGAILVGAGFGGYSWVRSAKQSALARRTFVEAEAALAREEWDKASALYREVERLDSGDRHAQRRAAIAEEMRRGEEALASREAHLRRYRSHSCTEMPSHEPASKKEPHWGEHQSMDRSLREANIAEEQAFWHFRGALAIDPSLSPARLRIARICERRYEEKEAAGDRASADWWYRQMLSFGGTVFLRPATLSLGTDPSDSLPYLFRYETRNLRQVPIPFHPVQGLGSVELRSVDALPLGAGRDATRVSAYPLECTEFNRIQFPLSLAAGSYLVVFEKSGHERTRYPVLLTRAQRLERTVKLLPKGSLPEEFVYVPGGMTILAGDPYASVLGGNPRPRVKQEVNSFLISRFPLTVQEYVKFLNDRSWQTAAAAEKRICRLAGDPVDGQYSPAPEHLDYPAAGMSYEDALAFAEWYTKVRGRGKWRFRLPSEAEWERAARGADGRYYPWGDEFNASFAAVGGSRQKIAPEPVGLFPANESVFGVFDMAGGVENYTSTEVTVLDNVRGKVVKGGSYTASGRGCRAASFGVVAPSHASEFVGMRLVADDPDSE